MSFTRLAAIIRLGRPKFLIYSMVLAALGPSCSVFLGYPFQLKAYLQVQLFAWIAHLMTHYCNEYFDFAADSANPSPTRWTGGSRVLVEGLLTPQFSLALAHALLFAA